MGSLSWLKITTHATSSPSSVYLWSTRSFCQSVKKAVFKEQQQRCSCCWHALLCKFRHIEIYMRSRFLLVRDEIGSLYNFCLQKWTYFLLLDKQGIVLRTLIQEVSFFSHYSLQLHFVVNNFDSILASSGIMLQGYFPWYWSGINLYLFFFNNLVSLKKDIHVDIFK